MAYVLAGGRGSRLMELTDRRAKPAVYFGGKSRIIDFALSNALNSGIRRIAVATQYKAHSLIRHLQRGWNFFRPERNESFDILPASQRVSETMWYLGTADAVYQNIDIIESYVPQSSSCWPATTSTRWTTKRCCSSTSTGRRRHRRLPRGPLEEATGFGVMHVDERTASSFLEKPKNPPPMPGKPDVALVQHGHLRVRHQIFLIEELRATRPTPNSSHDFGKDIIPYLVKNGKAVAHHFERSCVRSSEEAKPIGATSAPSTPIGRQHRPDRYRSRSRPLRSRWPIWTYGEITPPAKFVHDVDGRAASRSPRWSRAAASSRARRSPVAGVHRRARAFLRRPSTTR
jgi:glucose-1-phosphate adenylyltransferase